MTTSHLTAQELANHLIFLEKQSKYLQRQLNAKLKRLQATATARRAELFAESRKCGTKLVYELDQSESNLNTLADTVRLDRFAAGFYQQLDEALNFASEGLVGKPRCQPAKKPKPRRVITGEQQEQVLLNRATQQ